MSGCNKIPLCFIELHPVKWTVKQKQDGNMKSLVTNKGCQRFSLGKARQIAPCCHLVKGFASGLSATLDQLPSVC